MFRQTASSIRVPMTIAVAVGATSSVLAKDIAESGETQAETWQLLTDWFKAGSNIERLSGRFERHTYDNTYQIEKIATGEFWYSAPNKGRMHVVPVKITPEMIQERMKPKAQVRRGKDGMPFGLQPDRAERWICNELNLYDINEETKEAYVVPLTQQHDHRNSLKRRYWFFFGLPPEQAIKRFRVEIVKDYRPKQELVRLKATPVQRAGEWSHMQIILNTRRFLPMAVQLNDPSGVNQIVYKFKDLDINEAGKTGAVICFTDGDPFDPKLDGFKVTVIKPQEP